MRFGKPLHHFSSVESTQDTARSLVLRGEPAGTVVSTDYQTRGRGRLGRSWFAPTGTNVCMTVVLPPVSLVDAWQLAIVAGVSVAEGVMLASTTHPRVRFPNDIYLENRKLAGVLVETVAQGQTGLVTPLIGIGVNVNIAVEHFPVELREKATSLLRATGAPHSVELVRTAILSRLEANWETYTTTAFGETLLIRWRELSDPNAYRVFVLNKVPTLCRVLRISGDGNLTLETEAGERHTLPGSQVILGE